jgi:hypothetical protein
MSETPRRDAPRSVVALMVATAWGLIVAVGAYAVVRAIQAFIYPEPNPASVVWSAHSGYFWRMLTVSYAGGIAAFVAFVLARENLERPVRALAPSAVVVAALLAAQTVLLP